MEDLYEHKIREGLKDLASNYGPDAIIPVTVTSVDTVNYMCDCTADDGLDIPQVLYKNFSDGNVDLIMQPAVNSRIWVGRINNTEEWIMLKPGKMDYVAIKSGAALFELTSGIIKMNGGDNGGLVLKEGLIEKLNTIESSLNTLKTLMQDWIPAPGDGGAALKTLITTWAGTALTETVAADIENTNILQ